MSEEVTLSQIMQRMDTIQDTFFIEAEKFKLSIKENTAELINLGIAVRKMEEK